MESLLCWNRLLLVGIIALICGIVIGNVFLSKWSFYDEPSHLQSEICNITHCNVAVKTCEERGNRYACNVLNIVLSIDLNGKNYSREVRWGYLEHRYDMLREPTVCYYDDRAIDRTLDVEKISTVSEIILGVISLGMSIMIIILLIVWITSLKLKSEYVELDSDEIALNVQILMPES